MNFRVKVLYIIPVVLSAVLAPSLSAQSLTNWTQEAGVTASQSSTAYSGVASRAIDGNTNSAWSSKTLTHTAATLDASWQVDLGQDRPISEIVLYNRDIAQERLSNFSVSIIDSSGAVTAYKEFYTAGGNVGLSESWNDFGNVTGRVVEVSRLGSSSGGGNALTLSEVEVLGAESVASPAFVSPYIGQAELMHLQNADGSHGDHVTAVVRQLRVDSGSYSAGAVVPIGAYADGTVHKLVVSTTGSDSAAMVEFSVSENGTSLDLVNFYQTGGEKISILKAGVGSLSDSLELALELPAELGGVMVTHYASNFDTWVYTQYGESHFTSLGANALVKVEAKGDISMGVYSE